MIPSLKLWIKTLKGELSLNSYQNRAMSTISFTFLIDLVVPSCHCPSLPNNNIRWLLHAISKNSGIKWINRANAFLSVKFYLAWSVSLWFLVKISSVYFFILCIQGQTSLENFISPEVNQNVFQYYYFREN